jgi:hypothetical protein
MIQIEEVLPDHILKVLVDDDGLQDELFARVVENTGTFIHVLYLVVTSKFYKGAEVYELEETVHPVELESVCEHYCESPFSPVPGGLFALADQVDPEDSDSEVHDDSDSDAESDGDGFVVADDVVDGRVTAPSESARIDSEWRQWVPPTPGARRFKETVDALEHLARIHADNLNF